MTLLKNLQLSEPTPSIGEKQKVVALAKIALTFGLTGSKQRKQHLDLFFSLEKQSRDKEAGPGPLVG